MIVNPFVGHFRKRFIELNGSLLWKIVRSVSCTFFIGCYDMVKGPDGFIRVFPFIPLRYPLFEKDLSVRFSTAFLLVESVVE